MEVLKFSLLATFFLTSCAFSDDYGKRIVNNVEGCFSIIDSQLDLREDLVILKLAISHKEPGVDCPCKSALMHYFSFQKMDGSVSNLLSGDFNVLEKDKVALPIAVQKQLLYKGIPIQVLVSCASN